MKNLIIVLCIKKKPLVFIDLILSINQKLKIFYRQLNFDNVLIIKVTCLKPNSTWIIFLIIECLVYTAIF